MAAVTFDDLDPQEGDDVISLKQKQILAIQAATEAITPISTEPPQYGDSWTQLETKHLQALREHQAALEGT